jgi:hypothetical protein
LVGVAVKVTLVPEQMAPDGLAAILTEGTTVLVTVIVIVFEVAVTGLAQVAFDVITQLIVLPLVSVLLTKVGVLFPVFPPFNFH